MQPIKLDLECARHCIDRNCLMTEQELEFLLTDPEAISLPIWLGLNALLLKDKPRHHNSYMRGLINYARSVPTERY